MDGDDTISKYTPRSKSVNKKTAQAGGDKQNQAISILSF
jgi:hypothetical protein